MVLRCGRSRLTIPGLMRCRSQIPTATYCESLQGLGRIETIPGYDATPKLNSTAPHVLEKPDPVAREDAGDLCRRITPPCENRQQLLQVGDGVEVARGLLGAEATVEIGAGAVTLQRANIGHGLYNPFAEELDFIRVAVSTPDETFTTIDLDDDLRERRPTR